MRYIDIHSHIIYDVDDGSRTLRQSMKSLLEIKKIGLENVVCTPHIMYGSKEKLEKKFNNFNELKKYAETLNIKLYMGSEILWSDKTIDLLNKKQLPTLNNTNYILLEFKRNEHMHINNIVSILEDLEEAGYKVVLAHPELYINYRNIEDMYKIKRAGAMLQVDATSLYDRRKIKKFTKKLLKERLVDIVASDSHCTKKRNFKILKKCYKKIKNKYGNDYTDIMFYQNPLKVIGGKYEKEK